MNIIQIQDDLKGLPDQELISEVQNPSGVAPVYLLLGELQRREKMRAEFAGQQQPTQTVAEQIIEEAIAPAPPMPMADSPVPPGPGQAIPPAGEVVDVNRMNEVVTPQGAEMTDTNMLASRGVGALPAPNVGQYAEGGVVGFQDGGFFEFNEGVGEAERTARSVRPEIPTTENYNANFDDFGLSQLLRGKKKGDYLPPGALSPLFKRMGEENPKQAGLMRLLSMPQMRWRLDRDYAQGGIVGFAPGGDVADPYNLPYEELNKGSYFGSGQQLGDDYWSLPVMEVVGEQHQEDIGTRGELYTDDSVTVEQDLNPLPIGDQITRQHLTNIEGDEYLGEGEGGLFDSDTLGYGMSKEESIEKLENDPRYKPYLTPQDPLIDRGAAWETIKDIPGRLWDLPGAAKERLWDLPKDYWFGEEEKVTTDTDTDADEKPPLKPKVDKHWEEVAERMGVKKGQYNKLLEGQIASGGKSSYGDDKTLKDRTAEIEKMMHDMGIYDSKEDERAAKVAARIEREEARSAWNAVTMAGLSMMQGDSQFALTNIGKGIEDGISAYEKSEQKIADLEDKKLELAEKKATRDRDKKIAALTLAVDIEKSNQTNMTNLLTASAKLENDIAIANANNIAKQVAAQIGADARVEASLLRASQYSIENFYSNFKANNPNLTPGTNAWDVKFSREFGNYLLNIQGQDPSLDYEGFQIESTTP